jgi:hypothetical protein
MAEHLCAYSESLGEFLNRPDRGPHWGPLMVDLGVRVGNTIVWAILVFDLAELRCLVPVA